MGNHIQGDSPLSAIPNVRAVDRGFTLIELLVATALLALMALVAFEGLRFATRAWSSTVVRAARADEIWTAQRFLRGRLEALYPFEPAPAANGRVYSVEGQERELFFTAPHPASAVSDGFYRFHVFTRSEATGTALWVAWRLDRSGRADELGLSGWNEERLIGDIARLQWEYLEAREDQTPRWISEWQRQISAPALVRLRIEFPEGDDRFWPELVVRPRIFAHAQCAFDVVSRRCRATI